MGQFWDPHDVRTGQWWGEARHHPASAVQRSHSSVINPASQRGCVVEPTGQTHGRGLLWLLKRSLGWLVLDILIMAHTVWALAQGGYLLVTLLTSHFMKRDTPRGAKMKAQEDCFPRRALWSRFGTSPEGLCDNSSIHRMHPGR